MSKNLAIKEFKVIHKLMLKEEKALIIVSWIAADDISDDGYNYKHTMHGIVRLTQGILTIAKIKKAKKLLVTKAKKMISIQKSNFKINKEAKRPNCREKIIKKDISWNYHCL